MTVFLFQQGEEDSYWACSMLFEGASCQLPDDWKLEQRRLQQDVAARQQQQALKSKQQVCHKKSLCFPVADSNSDQHNYRARRCAHVWNHAMLRAIRAAFAWKMFVTGTAEVSADSTSKLLLSACL